MEKKKIRLNLTIFCYAFAALLLIYACYSAWNTIHDIREYYKAYEMSASAKEYITYVLQAILQPLVYAITIFTCGHIEKQGRKNHEELLEKLEEVSAKKPSKKKTLKKGETEDSMTKDTEKQKKKSSKKKDSKKEEEPKEPNETIDKNDETTRED